MERMSSEGVPVSEALMPVYNQLSTVKRCLLEVSKWGKPDSSKPAAAAAAVAAPLEFNN